MIMRYVVLLLIILLSNLGFSQNPRKETPVGINFSVGGPGLSFAASLDVFIFPSVNVEGGLGSGGLGFFSGSAFFGGLKFHSDAYSSSNWTLYTGGFLIGTSETFDSPRGKEEGKNVGLFYLPIGLQYFTNNGFTFGYELAGIFDKKADLINDHFAIWFGIKIGMHFSLNDGRSKKNRRKTTYKEENIEYFTE